MRRGAEVGWVLPPLGPRARSPRGLALAVRPERWLMVLAPHRGHERHAVAGASGHDRRSGGAVRGARRFLPRGRVCTREVLRRGCRLDLDPGVFAAGSAAATQMAQVAVTLAALPGGLLLVTPASTARHLREWLMQVGRAFGIAAVSDVTVAALSGDP